MNNNMPQTTFVNDPEHVSLNKDPIIDHAEVQWAARKFILIHGSEAPEAAMKEVVRLEKAGKFQVSEMFERVSAECARLLKRSEKLRSRVCH